MRSKVVSLVPVGTEAARCEVGCDVSRRGLSRERLVGLLRAAVTESVERVRRAIINGGSSFPMRAVSINLAPADVKKEAPTLGLPIAVGLLGATNLIKGDRHRDHLIAGELGPDGGVRRIRGALSLALLAQRLGIDGEILPEGIAGTPVAAPGRAVAFPNVQPVPDAYQPDDQPHAASAAAGPWDSADVKGRKPIKRAVVAACGGTHTVPFVDPRGTNVPSFDGSALSSPRSPLARSAAPWPGACPSGRTGSEGP